MTTLQEKIAVMQAHADGRNIEYRWAGGFNSDYKGQWLRCADPVWNWGNYEYRVATVKEKGFMAVNPKKAETFLSPPVNCAKPTRNTSNIYYNTTREEMEKVWPGYLIVEVEVEI